LDLILKGMDSLCTMHQMARETVVVAEEQVDEWTEKEKNKVKTTNIIADTNTLQRSACNPSERQYSLMMFCGARD